ncbi:MAG TPA: GDP-L-fucose synthase [Candidatus Methanofastidiosum sp.]|nr:GDP-L-fucose synthase [Methanofastidiosum sp.]
MTFWDFKKVLVTGGAGFLGSYVVDNLEKKGVKDITIPRSYLHDLRVRENNNKMVKGKDIVIHLAVKGGGIGFNLKYPGAIFFDNLMMNTQLMEEARLANIQKFVAIGTVCSYPKFTPVPFKEENLWNGYPEETNAPYGLAKKMMLVQSQAYRQQYGFNSITLLMANLYGPKDNFDLESSHVIPALIRKFVDANENNKKEVEVWGTGEASREFLYVEDAAEAILLAAEKYNKSEPVNIGAGFEIKIKDLVELIAGIAEFDGEIKWDTSKPDGQPRRCLDVNRAKKEFGFEAKVDLREGLKKTIDWYKTNMRGRGGSMEIREGMLRKKKGGSRMQAIRDLIDTEKLKHIMNIPENFGDKVEVIVLPFNKDEKSKSYYLMKMQQHPGYIQALLNDPDEDVWDDL